MRLSSVKFFNVYGLILFITISPFIAVLSISLFLSEEEFYYGIFILPLILVLGALSFFIRCPHCHLYIFRRNRVTESYMSQFQIRIAMLKGICPHCKDNLSTFPHDA